ncbi:UDP-glucose 4-epimerase family protein [Stutzerimonas zhaodongensis]|uniref:UDP-glucose 4-epimerase family protein n=1 Tax=Stutzerimonas zhaodongensis TaxID=1176257 RepID=UPI0039EF17D8
MSRKILLTGATGFVGKALLAELARRGQAVVATARQAQQLAGAERCIQIADLNGDIDWQRALFGIDVVIHAAARVHVLHEQAADPLTEFRRANADGTLVLARQAAEAEVRRFVFISTIKVLGEQTLPDSPFRADDVPRPTDPYGVSKREAEDDLLALAAETGMEVVVIRPPLVYGPGVKGNFASMIKLVEKGLPLPLGAIQNKRSMVGIGNLVDLISRCVDHPAAANQVLLAGDGEDLSTTELLRSVAEAMGKPARLIPVPAGMLTLCATLLGKKAMAQRLLGSLQVDISKTRNLMGWTPPYSVREGLRHCFERP